AVPNRIEPGDPPAVLREEEVVGAAVHRGDGGERAPAGAQGTRRGESPRVAEAAADQRKVGVQEPRADELAELTRCGDAAVRQDLDEADLGPQMQRPALALAGPCDRLAHAVRLAHRAPERRAIVSRSHSRNGSALVIATRIVTSPRPRRRTSCAKAYS